MNFIYPAFLFALFAVIIPILIHFFSFRRFTTVYFSNVNYLKNIKKESQKKSQLKHLLILLARILTIVCLVFAFAQPFIPSKNQRVMSDNPVVSIYIDNSFSMNALSIHGQLLEQAKTKAFEIADAYPLGTNFRLLTNDMHPRHQHLFNKEQFIRQISEIKASPRTTPLSMINNKILTGFSQNEAKAGSTNYFISDFQAEITDLENFKTDSLYFNYFLPISPGVISNLYIDSCWMEIPAHKIGQEELLHVKIINQSEEAFQNIPVKFYLNDTAKALANFNIEARGEQTVELKYLNLSPGLQLGNVEVSDYPIVHDNNYYLNYTVQNKLKALAVYGAGYKGKTGLPWLRALFEGDDYVEYDEVAVENLAVSKLPEYNTIFILNIYELSSGVINELVRAAENGASLVFFPEPEGQIDNYNNFLSRLQANTISRFDTAKITLGGIEWKHPVYSQVFREQTEDIAFPSVAGSFVFSPAVRVAETPLLWFRNNAKALSTQPAGNGNLAVFSFPLSGENQDFARHILFVPTLYSLVVNSLPYQKLAYTIGREPAAVISDSIRAEITSYSVKSPDGQTFIPQISTSENNTLRIGLNEPFGQAGHYEVLLHNKPVAAVSMNYDRRESDFRFFNFNELKTEIERNNLPYTEVVQIQDGKFSDVFDELSNGKKIWKWFIVLALLFVAAEALISRFWK